ncbi:MAG: dienelactone hydrolase family protein [Rhodospirillales bacterium]|nr:dienelactone hydrolase family protein [Rhodospirillales bacterium]MBO6785231.1 dienelactone hydrolase family protein [Rhodospirillales bacterium]
MPEQIIDIETEDGVMPTFTCWPEGNGPWPAIVFYMDAPAIREELFDMARRMASDGYFVILPDLFYRFGIIRFPFRNANTRAVWQEIMRHLSNEDVMRDTRAMLDYMAGEDVVKPGPKATIGYCMSGRFVTAAAGTFPDDFAANASFYGVGIVTAKDDSAHFWVKHIKGEMYFAFAETDGTVPAYVIPTLKAELEEHGTDYTLKVFPGTEHGFSFKSRDVYDEAAAEEGHAHFMDMCKRKLG